MYLYRHRGSHAKIVLMSVCWIGAYRGLLCETGVEKVGMCDQTPRRERMPSGTAHQPERLSAPPSFRGRRTWPP